MAILIKKTIQLNTGKFKFKFNLLSGVTIIGGESATGKTMFYNKLQEKSIATQDTSYIFLNYKNFPIDRLPLVSGKLIIIDNADILLDENLVKQLHADKKNQYILFGRQNRKFRALKENITIIQEKDRSFELFYTYRTRK